jgi:hypothetical protein
MNRARKERVVLAACAAAAFAIAACDGGEEDYLSAVDDAVVAELERLSVEPTADAEIFQEELPADLGGDSNWGLKEIVCAEGGYDLSPYAGMTVTLTGVEIEGSCQEEAIMIWVVSLDDSIACAYLTVRKASGMVPGVWAVNDDDCDT